jgi:hypothetical protein
MVLSKCDNSAVYVYCAHTYVCIAAEGAKTKGNIKENWIIPIVTKIAAAVVVLKNNNSDVGGDWVTVSVGGFRISSDDDGDDLRFVAVLLICDSEIHPRRRQRIIHPGRPQTVDNNEEEET